MAAEQAGSILPESTAGPSHFEAGARMGIARPRPHRLCDGRARIFARGTSAMASVSGLIEYYIRRLTPKSRSGDYLLALRHFIGTHKRLPSDRSLLNDYLFHLKTGDEALDPLRQFISDKEHVKTYVRSKIGDAFNVPTLAVLKSREDVDRYDFPGMCCIKPTHASGRAIIRTGGEPVDRERIKSWLDFNHYDDTREVNYRYLVPKIIVEPLIFENGNIEDYKIFCFRGKPRLIQVDIDRYIDHTRLYFDDQWNEMDFSILYPKSGKNIARPECLAQMLDLAARLSEDFEFIRVDFYTDGRNLLVGELTNCPENASGTFIPASAEKEASRLIFAG